MYRFKKLFISSIPRSGSTVLTNMLDRYEDIFCLPESFFPVALDCVDMEEWRRKDHIAALFIVSCSDGSPLTFEEARSCIRDTKEETLDAIAERAIRKAGRDPATIQVVVWKYTRLVGRWRFAASAKGRFLILRRNPLNVYLSQFRVPFGQKNKNPFRFALFEASYRSAFCRYPSASTSCMNYAEIESSIGPLLGVLGSTGKQRPNDNSGIGSISGERPWHSDINKPFKNTDIEKIKNIGIYQKMAYYFSQSVLTIIPILPRFARIVADRRQITTMRSQAASLLLNRPSPVTS